MVRGGPFTRKDPTTHKMSCLDLFVVSCELLPYVKDLVIDSKRDVAVSRPVGMGTSYRQVYSDKFSCVLTLTDLPRARERREEKQVVWNLSKEGGWERYRILTDKYSEALQEAVDGGNSMDNKMAAFEKIHNKIKFKSFGKVKIGGKHKEKEKEKVTDNIGGINEAKNLYDEEEARANKEIEEIKNLKVSKVGKIWEVKKRIVGGNKALIQSTAITNPENGKLVVTQDSIKHVTLKYCKDTLTNNIPEIGYQNFIEDKRTEVNKKLSEVDGCFAPEKETFECLLNKFKKSKKPNYHVLVRAGKSFQNTVFNFCKYMMDKEEFPSNFRDTTLHMIFKGGKGRRHQLKDNRFIHSKSWFPRTAEGLAVLQGLKDPLLEGSSIYQIGGQPGHRSEEHIFVLKPS